jgi:hypothetical protein
MHGLINVAIQQFVASVYGAGAWNEVAARVEIGREELEPMLSYPDSLTENLITEAAGLLGKPPEDLLEDIGVFLVVDPRVASVRRLLRFGGASFVEFLYSLEALPDRARLALPDLDLPELELEELGSERFRVTCRSPHAGFGSVLVGILRALADDYGALVLIECEKGKPAEEILLVALLTSRFAAGRRFELAAGHR